MKYFVFFLFICILCVPFVFADDTPQAEDEKVDLNFVDNLAPSKWTIDQVVAWADALDLHQSAVQLRKYRVNGKTLLNFQYWDYDHLEIYPHEKIPLEKHVFGLKRAHVYPWNKIMVFVGSAFSFLGFLAFVLWPDSDFERPYSVPASQVMCFMFNLFGSVCFGVAAVYWYQPESHGILVILGVIFGLLLITTIFCIKKA